MYSIVYTKSFRKDIKRIRNNNSLIKKFCFILDCLINENKVDEKYKKHKLNGYLKDFFEIHIEPDILLIYKVDNEQKNIILSRIGSHSYLKIIM